MKKGETVSWDTQGRVAWLIEYYSAATNEASRVGGFYAGHPNQPAEMIYAGKNPGDAAMLRLACGVLARHLKQIATHEALHTAEDGVTGTNPEKLIAVLRLEALRDGGLIMVDGKAVPNPSGPRKYGELAGAPNGRKKKTLFDRTSSVAQQ